MPLPGTAQEIADVIGREKALLLIGQLPRCGTRSWRVNLYVPKRLKPDHQLVRILGWPDAMAMVREFGGMILEPPNCSQIYLAFRNRNIHRLARAGKKPHEIAQAVGLSCKQVGRILRDMTPEDRAGHRQPESRRTGT